MVLLCYLTNHVLANVGQVNIKKPLMVQHIVEAVMFNIVNYVQEITNVKYVSLQE